MPRKGGSGGGGGGSYVNNASNRSLGRVGMSYGSASVSSSSGSSSVGAYGGGSSISSASRTYVDNSMNRSIGRVGMTLGSAPVSRTSGSSPSYQYSSNGASSRTYVDNSMNRDLGRVGMTLGSAPVSRTSGSNSSYHSSNGASSRTYVDNSMNRDLGRVGMSIGSAPVSRTSVSSPAHRSSSSRTYVDNSMNRKLGRVGLAVGSMPVSKSSKMREVQNAYREYEDNPVDYSDAFSRYLAEYQQQDPYAVQPIQEMFERLKVWEQEKYHKHEEYTRESRENLSGRRNNARKTPFESYIGAVIQYDELQIEKKIGHGGFGDVFKGLWLGKVVAIKKLRVQRVSKRRLTQFEEEVNVFGRLHHKNIITFYGACIITPNLCMVMELMSGSLYDKILIEEYQFTNANNLLIIKEIACGLEYLHSQEVAHCDIKLSNILIDIFKQDDFHVKLTDFGLSLMKNNAESSTSTVVSGIGTPRYSAPEVLRGESLNRDAMKMADVYSFGLIVYEILSVEEVFEDLTVHQLRKQIGDGETMPPLEQLRHELDDDLMELMSNCWLRNPTRRPTIKNASLILSKLSS